MVEKNKFQIKTLLEDSRKLSADIEFRRRMAANSKQNSLKYALTKLWEDPDRGNFNPDFNEDVKRMRTGDLNREMLYNKIYLMSKKYQMKRFPYFGVCLRRSLC